MKAIKIRSIFLLMIIHKTIIENLDVNIIKNINFYVTFSEPSES